MSRLAVIGTFYRRPWAVPRIARAIREQERRPDELWLMWEDPADAEALASERWGCPTRIIPVRPARHADGSMAEVAPSAAINKALDMTRADYITYLTDDSLPAPDKYAAIVKALDEHGAVYCSQDYGSVSGPEEWLGTPRGGGIRRADHVSMEPCYRVDHTQVAHRRSEDRWPTELRFLRFSDGEFFNAIARRFGGLHPIHEVLDWTRQLPDGISAR